VKVKKRNMVPKIKTEKKIKASKKKKKTLKIENQVQTHAHRPSMASLAGIGGLLGLLVVVRWLVRRSRTGDGERTVTFGRRSGDGVGRTGGGLVGGRRWRSVGLREEMERGRVSWIDL